MLILAVVILIIVLFCLIPVFFHLEYSESGFCVQLSVLFFKLSNREKKSKKKNSRKSRKEEKKEKKPGSAKQMLAVIGPAVDALGRLIRRLVVKRLVMNITLGSRDAYSTAMLYGKTAAGIGAIFPFLDRGMKIKHKSISVNADFEAEEISVYLLADIRISAGVLIATATCFLCKYLRKINIKKGNQKNG
ncbi:MAG: DUF2953 domain-containing protein [Lachnospiraceae bacterium]|nr:DUF2953 domain-containing protein [Lachnospiraceae bacterium]